MALDVVSDAALVSSAIARTLGLYDGPGRPAGEGVARHLAERTALLVLDNFEHLLAAAPETARLLQAAPDVRIVVTSRAPLRIGGEQDYPLGPLEARGGPEGPSTAERLFLERAEGARPGWSATADHGVVQ